MTITNAKKKNTPKKCDACKQETKTLNNISLAPYATKELIILRLCDECYEAASKKIGEALNK